MLQRSSPSKTIMNPEMVSFGTLAVNVNGVGTLYAPITALISPPELATTSGSPSPFSFGSEVTSVAVTPMVSPTALVTWTEHVCADAGLDCSDITAHISNTKRPTRFMPTSLRIPTRAVPSQRTRKEHVRRHVRSRLRSRRAASTRTERFVSGCLSGRTLTRVRDASCTTIAEEAALTRVAGANRLAKLYGGRHGDHSPGRASGEQAHGESDPRVLGRMGRLGARRHGRVDLRRGAPRGARELFHRRELRLAVDVRARRRAGAARQLDPARRPRVGRVAAEPGRRRARPEDERSVPEAVLA